MKVSRKSWHYRMYRFWHSIWHNGEGPWGLGAVVLRGYRTDPQPTNLCKYFWFCVINVTFGWFALLGAWILLALLYIFVGPFMWIHDKLKERRARQGKPEKGPSPIAAGLRARKQKVCPLIEVVD